MEGATRLSAPTRFADMCKSPPFRFISRRYPLSQLQEALAEGTVVGHEGPETPHFQFGPAQIDALLASVQTK
jgi:hypothetical protein